MRKILLAIIFVFLMLEVFPQDSKDIHIRFENRKMKGYYNTTQISLLMGNRHITDRNRIYPYWWSSSIAPYFNYDTRTEMQIVPSLTMTNGYMFNEHWAAGIGVGFEIFDRNLFPVFADIRYTLWDNKISPFFAVKTGYAIGSVKEKHYDNLTLNFEPYYVYNADYRNYGGFMLHPEMGVMAPLSNNADLLLTVAYRYQKTKSVATQKYDNNSYDRWIHRESLNRLSFGVAIMFR